MYVHWGHLLKIINCAFSNCHRKQLHTNVVENCKIIFYLNLSWRFSSKTSLGFTTFIDTIIIGNYQIGSQLDDVQRVEHVNFTFSILIIIAQYFLHAGNYHIPCLAQFVFDLKRFDIMHKTYFDETRRSWVQFQDSGFIKNIDCEN